MKTFHASRRLLSATFTTAFVACAALTLPGCAGGGGGGHGGGGGGGGGASDPVPGVSSLSPGSTNADPSSGAAVTLTVNGTNFISNSAVLLDGVILLGTTFVSATQLTVPIPASDLAATGTASITVSNPPPGGGTSNAATWFINAPTPALASSALSPSSASALSGGFVLKVSATHIAQNSLIAWNGQFLDTTLATVPTSSGGVGVLSAPINNSLIASAGAVPVTVVNLNADGSIGPGSAAQNFTINIAGANSAPIACLLAGTRSYAFVFTGTDNTGAASMVGSIGIKTDGSLNNSTANSYTDFKDSVQLAAASQGGTTGRMIGGAGSCADSGTVPNTGTVTFTVQGTTLGTFVLQYALRANGNGGRLVATNSALGLNATGQLQVQSAPDSFGIGSFAFGLGGRSGAGSRYAVAGAFCGDANGGAISFLQADFDDNGTAATATAAGLKLTQIDAPSGRITSNQVNFMTGGTSRPLTLTLYPLDGNKAYVMDSTAIATSAQVLGGVITGHHGNLCLAQGLNGSFDNSALGTAGSGAVFTLHGDQSGVTTAAVGALTNITPSGGGAGCAAGQGSASLTADFNAGGVAHPVTAVTACYSVVAAGRGVMSFTDPSNNTMQGATFYLDGFGSGYVIGNGADIAIGSVGSQVTPIAAIGGIYSFGPDNVAASTTVLPVASVTIDATAKTFTAAGGGSSSTAAYVLDSTTGRGTATLNTPSTFGDTQIVFYVIGGRTIQAMDAAAPTPVLGLLVQ
jgi:hypothetical protein